MSGLLAIRATVLVEGPPRCGRSTIAGQLAAGFPAGAVMLDARGREGRAMLASPGTQSAARPVILDNASADDARRLAAGLAAQASASQWRQARFVLVGGPFTETGKTRTADGGAETAVVRAGPLSLFEAGRASTKRLWLRGGYPEAYTAASDDAAFGWLETYAADLSCGALSAWGMPREPALMTALMETVAARNGEAFNENAAARGLGVSRPTIARYLRILESAGILFAVPALPRGDAGAIQAPARSVRSPALYIRDSGLLHALTGARPGGEPAAGPRTAAASWTGFIVSQAREALPEGARIYRYASADGAALDMVILRDGKPPILAVARRHRPSSLERSVSYAARAILGQTPGHGCYMVAPEGEERELPGGFIVISAGSFLEMLRSSTA